MIPFPIPNPATAGLSPAAPMVLAKWLGEARRVAAIGRRWSKTPLGLRSRFAGEYNKTASKKFGAVCFVEARHVLGSVRAIPVYSPQ